MKPIEIRIEGYKIVISEDKEPQVAENVEKEKVTYVPYPITPTVPQSSEWWRYPYATWKVDDYTITNTID